MARGVAVRTERRTVTGCAALDGSAMGTEMMTRRMAARLARELAHAAAETEVGARGAATKAVAAAPVMYERRHARLGYLSLQPAVVGRPWRGESAWPQT